MQTLSPGTLASRIAETAVLHGSFTLRSGRTSDYYIDKYLYLCRPEILEALARMIAPRIPAGTRRLAGAELGGVPLVTAAALATGLPCVLVREAKKVHGTGRRIEGALEPGDRVVLVEDVATTGGAALEAVGALREAGATVAMVIATIDREEGARPRIEAAGCAFEALFTKRDLGL